MFGLALWALLSNRERALPFVALVDRREPRVAWVARYFA